VARVVCFIGIAALFAPASCQAQTFTTLVNFNGTNGYVRSALVQGTDGNFYGTGEGGGANGSGTIFRLTPAGKLTTLYSFCSQVNCADGGSPQGLIQASDGNFYGTTNVGGADLYGTVFKFTPGGTLTTLYSFCSQANCADGAEPLAGLVQGTDGNLYGTTSWGGLACYDPTSCAGGTVFRVAPGGALTTLYSFCSQLSVSGAPCTDGSTPLAGLIQALDGDLYGATDLGGDTGGGTVFKITPGGMLTKLYSFGGGEDGEDPQAGLIQATDGNFYGTQTFLAERLGLIPGLSVGWSSRSRRPARSQLCTAFVPRPGAPTARSLILGFFKRLTGTSTGPPRMGDRMAAELPSRSC